MRYMLTVILAGVVFALRAAAAESTTDADFIRDSYINNLKEHAVAGLAEAKSGDQRVKQFASTLSKDHLKANEEIKRVAETMHVKLPEYSDDKQSYDKLANMTGDAFDRAFVNWTLDTHTREFAMLEAQAKTAGGDLKTFIDRQMPVEKSHLDTARALSDSFSRGAMRDVPVNDNQQPIDVRYDPPRNSYRYDAPNMGQKAGDNIRDAGDEATRRINESGLKAKEFSPPNHDKSLDFVR